MLFHSNRYGNYDIYTLEFETWEVTRLTDSPEHDVEPALSPDGTRVAFARARSSPRGQDIYVMNLDGTNPQRITHMDDSIAMCPDWSPDGSQIAFYATLANHFHVFVVSSEGGEATELPGGPTNDMMPDWSPDGSEIAFVSDRDGRGELYVMSADGSNPRRLTDSMADEWRPRWHPDGGSIVYQSDQTGHWEVYLIDVGTTEIEQVTDGLASSEMPAWSGNGHQIYFSREEDGYYDLYVLDLEEYVVQRLTQTSLVDDRYPVWGER